MTTWGQGAGSHSEVLASSYPGPEWLPSPLRLLPFSWTKISGPTLLCDLRDPGPHQACFPVCELGGLSLEMDISLVLSCSIASASGPGAAGPQVACGGQWVSQGRWALSWGLSLQSLIVPGKSPTRKKSGPFGSRRSSAIGIENIQEVQEKRWVGGSPVSCGPFPGPRAVAELSEQEGVPAPLPPSLCGDSHTVKPLLCAKHQGQLITYRETPSSVCRSAGSPGVTPCMARCCR